MNDTLNCVYVTDKNFLPCTCFSINTLVANASCALRIFILWADAEPQDIEKAKHYLQDNGINAEFIEIPNQEFEGLRRPKSLPRATYGRLMMHKLLPGFFERVVYIDGDTLVDIDVAPLLDLPLDGSTIGAVLDVGRILIGRREEAQQRLELGPSGDYFNAGFLLIDWPKWLSKQVGPKTVEALSEDSERFVQNDQCALNYVCRRDWKALPLKWNYQPACIVHEDQEGVLYHFLGSRKPWVSDHARHPARFLRRYEKMYAQSPWADQFNKTAMPYEFKDLKRLAKQYVTPRYWKNVERYKTLLKRYGANG